jgi:hypothetical protein
MKHRTVETYLLEKVSRPLYRVGRNPSEFLDVYQNSTPSENIFQKMLNLFRHLKPGRIHH